MSADNIRGSNFLSNKSDLQNERDSESSITITSEMLELQKIVMELETGKSLEKSVILYEEGMKRYKSCENAMRNIKKEVDEIFNDMVDSEITVEEALVKSGENISNLSFEYSFDRIELLIKECENDETTVENLLSNGRRIKALTNYCLSLLDKMRLKVIDITKNSDASIMAKKSSLESEYTDKNDNLC